MDLFGEVPAALRPYLPSFKHTLVDLSRVADPDLSAMTRLRAFLKALKYARRPDLRELIYVVLAESAELEERDLFIILRYLDRGAARMTNEELREIIRKSIPEGPEAGAGWITGPYYVKGLMEGQEKGIAKGKAALLARFLEKRFGELPESLRQRIFDADVETIDAWADRAFEAPSLQAVFESN
jgi:hypothetical protein